MVSILPSERTPWDVLGRDIGAALQGVLPRAIQQGQIQASNQKLMDSQKQALASQFGPHIAALSPEIQKLLIGDQLKNQRIQQEQNILGSLFSGSNAQVQQQPQQFQEQQQSFDVSKLPDDVIAQLAAVNPNAARLLQQQKDVALRENRAERKLLFEKEKLARKEEFEKGMMSRREETDISKPVLAELNQVRKNIPLQEQAILDIQEASPKVSALDYFADVTGFEPLRSAEGVKLKTGIKDFFLSDLTRVGARPNQWVEQQLADALPKIGRSTEANLITAEGMKFKVDLAKKRLEEIDKLAEEDRNKYGFVRADVDSRAYEAIKKYTEKRQEELKNNIQKIKSQKLSNKSVRVTSPEGSIYEISPEDIDEAMKHGYTITK